MRRLRVLMSLLPPHFQATRPNREGSAPMTISSGRSPISLFDSIPRLVWQYGKHYILRLGNFTPKARVRVNAVQVSIVYPIIVRANCSEMDHFGVGSCLLLTANTLLSEVDFP
jgi:hypothetical protein